MRRSVTFLLLAAFWACLPSLLCSSPASASFDDEFDAAETVKLRTGQFLQELRTRASRLTTGAAGSANDTLWVGYTPDQVSNANWWGVHAGFGKDGYNRPINGVPHKGVWDWETPVHGDSLQGWWPILNMYASAGGQIRTDVNRPWWALDFGNLANYRAAESNGRTFGVTGVWHRDGRLLNPAPSGLRTPGFYPAQGSFAAWMGLRAHGDNSFVDPVARGGTGNPFNEDVLMFVGFGAVSHTGNDQGFPGYGTQMDQMLYRDLDFAGETTSDLTVRFKFRTVLSTDASFTLATRTGWFDSDPLGEVSGPINQQRGNFISSSDAGDLLAPRDSFMVYIGSGVEANDWIPAAASLGQLGLPPRPVHDRKRRWFGEVLHWDRDSASAPPKYLRELLSVSGVWPARSDSQPASPSQYVDTTFVIPNAVLQPMLQKNNRIRLVFRVKTNRTFDDQGTAFSSNARGAAVVDHVRARIGANPEVLLGDFESPGDIDNDIAVPATDAWKSTGKPPAQFFHTHVFADLKYDDLCGRKGDISRQCNMSGVVISAGDHDEGEAAGGTSGGTAQRERNDGIMSPTIQLAGPYNLDGKNIHGFKPLGAGQGDIFGSEDYYIAYDIYTGALDYATHGNLWRYAVMSYPANAKSSALSYPAWGQMRFPGFIIYNPDPQCIQDILPLYRQGLMRTSNPNGIPDSLKIFIGKTQQCFRFGVSVGCSPIDGAYFDNVSLALIDGSLITFRSDPWTWFNDTFPASEVSALPGTAEFDTAGALLKTGLNTAQATMTTTRFDVPGDTVVVLAHPAAARVDMVFRILPGPGNYEPIGRPDQGSITRRPDSRELVSKGDGSFWDAYRQNPGVFASPGATTLHHNAPGGWDPNVWNSARCDTAEMNVFPRYPFYYSGLVIVGCDYCPPEPSRWMSTYHELDPHYQTLGIVRNRCFVRTPTTSNSDVVCDGTVPTYISSRPEHADVIGTTIEYTKIIPDGLLTPGAHVQYFFRQQIASASPGAHEGLCPDTSIVLQTIAEESTDGHRWQQVGVLPNAWKKPTYRHPVTQYFGAGPACLLVVDNDDRRGNEQVWVGIADTIGANSQRHWGAHNGWHAVGGGDVDDPADNRRGKDGQPGFVSEHIGQPGSGGAWDMYQVKDSERASAAGTIGSRRARRTGTGAEQLVIAKTSRQGPTLEMLNAYYTMMLFLSGDLNRNILGPFTDRSQNDVSIIQDWLHAGSTSTPNRGFWAIGDGFAESIVEGEIPTTMQFLFDDLATQFVSPNYIAHVGNTEELAHYRLFPGWQNKSEQQIQIYGMRNGCLWSNDVLAPDSGAVQTAQYEWRSAQDFLAAGAGVFKPWSPQSPYMSQVEGWDIEHLTHSSDANTLDRSGYFYKILRNVWSSLCAVKGEPIVPLDVPQDQAALVDFLRLANNPLTAGHARIRLGLSRPDRVEVRIFDVSGRLVRTLADRLFRAGEHDLVWDGADDSGRRVARGVYFTRARYGSSGLIGNRKLTVLK